MEHWKIIHSSFVQENYRSRLALFDQLFGLIPFKFPEFDPKISWYSDTDAFDNLVFLFSDERSKGRSLFERKIEAADEHLHFQVFPVQKTERNAFHDFVLNKFISEKTSIEKKAELQLSCIPNVQEEIKAKMNVIEKTLQWMFTTLKKNSPSLKNKFLQIVYNGTLASGVELNSRFNMRRKFIELYLYTQGLLIADHYYWLLQKYHAAKKG